MQELSVEERVRRLIGAAERKRKRNSLPNENRGGYVCRRARSYKPVPTDGMYAFVKSHPRPTTRKSGRA